MIKKLLLILLIGVSNIANTKAQQNMPQISQYMSNNSYINPSNTGIGNTIELSLLYRSQYTGYQTSNNDNSSALNTQILTANIPLTTINSGLGILVLNDKTSSKTSQQQLQLSYAYHLKLGENTLSLGIRSGLHVMKLDGFQFRPPTNEEDPKIPKGKEFSDNKLDFNVGIQYKTDRFYFGASLFHVNKPKFGTNINYNYKLERNLFFTGGYRYYLNDRIELNPSLLIITDFINPLAINTSLLLNVDNTYWIGAGYRFGDAGIVLAGLSLMQKKIKVSYSLDLTVKGNDAKSRTSSELMLSYVLPTFKTSSRKTIIKTPRFSF